MLKDKELIKPALMDVAQRMAIAARTAPKARGIDNIEIAIVEENMIEQISKEMKKIGEKMEHGGLFFRDADNILEAPVMVIIGTRFGTMELEKCGLCGFENCEENKKHPGAPCAFNTGDLGIAIGSAAAIAMDNRVDNRIMYTVGQAVTGMGILGKKVKIAYGIPLSATGKNPFFDRKKKK